jgi:hypothetical protein
VRRHRQELVAQPHRLLGLGQADALLGHPVALAGLALAQRRHQQQSVLRLERVEAQLGGKLAAVLAHPDQLRQQALEGLPDELVTAVAEQLLGQGIEKDDPAPAIRDHQRVGRSLQDGASGRGQAGQDLAWARGRAALVRRRQSQPPNLDTPAW